MENLKILTELNGLSGHEYDVRNWLLERVKEQADIWRIDRMGNLLAMKKGRNPDKTLMLSAHMDEVGLMVSGHNEDGTLKYTELSVEAAVLPGKHLFVGEDKLPGVLLIKPWHHQGADERKKPASHGQLCIDIGAVKKEEAEKLAPLGTPVYFNESFLSFGDNMMKAKALDDRAGCWTLLKAMEEEPEWDTWFCYTVQEEVGLRGAGVAAREVSPDLCVVVESTIAMDTAGIAPQDVTTTVGHGAALTYMDGRTIVAPALLKGAINLCDQESIRWQLKENPIGGNDAGAIQRTGPGVAVVSVSLPCRYIHSAVSVASQDDLQEVLKFVKAVVQKPFSIISEENL